MKTPAELSRFNSFIFDLDNTLYNEEDFLFIIYSEIAKYISAQNKINPDTVLSVIKKQYYRQGRKNIFQKLNEHFKLDTDIQVYLNIMRATKLPAINLFSIYYKVFEALIAARSQIFVLTNGTTRQQKNKVEAIRWKNADKFIRFYFAADYASKPDPEAINKIIRENNLEKTKTLFIGDSDDDLKCAVDAGISFMFNHQFEKCWTSV
jgi:HAD superfamily hydrolase (TIGR01549 family)